MDFAFEKKTKKVGSLKTQTKRKQESSQFEATNSKKENAVTEDRKVLLMSTAIDALIQLREEFLSENKRNAAKVKQNENTHQKQEEISLCDALSLASNQDTAINQFELSHTSGHWDEDFTSRAKLCDNRPNLDYSTIEGPQASHDGKECFVTSTPITEENSLELLLSLKKVFDSEGLQGTAKIAAQIQSQIGEFIPLNARTHFHSSKEIDVVAQHYLRHYCPGFETCSAISTKADGNCLMNCISLGLNNSYHQTNEMRLRAALEFAQNHDAIESEGHSADGIQELWAITALGGEMTMKALLNDKEHLDTFAISSLARALSIEINVIFPNVGSEEQSLGMSKSFNKNNVNKYSVTILWHNTMLETHHGVLRGGFNANHFSFVVGDGLYSSPFIKDSLSSKFEAMLLLRKSKIEKKESKKVTDKQNPISVHDISSSVEDQNSPMKESPLSHPSISSAKELEASTGDHKSQVIQPLDKNPDIRSGDCCPKPSSLLSDESGIEEYLNQVCNDEDEDNLLANESSCSKASSKAEESLVQGIAETEKRELKQIVPEETTSLIENGMYATNFRPVDEVLRILREEKVLENPPLGNCTGKAFSIKNDLNAERHKHGLRMRFSESHGAFDGGRQLIRVYEKMEIEGQIFVKPSRNLDFRKDGRYIDLKTKAPIPLSETKNLIALKMYYNANKANAGFKRRIAIVLQAPQEDLFLLNRCCYEYIGEWKKRVQHGNSKQNTQGYGKTFPESMDDLDEGVQRKTPMRAYCDTLKKRSGLQRPRNLRQAQSRKYLQKKARNETKSSNLAQAVVNVLNMLAKGDPCVQLVTFKNGSGGQPAVHLFHKELAALARGCTATDSVCPSVLVPDVTFNIGSYYVTQAVFECKALQLQGSDKSPTLVASNFLHFSTKYEDFLPMFQHLFMVYNQIKPMDENTKVITGSDQEKALVNAIRDGSKDKNIHVTCGKHLKNGTVRHLQKAGNSAKLMSAIKSAIYGQKGIVHTTKEKEEYDAKFAAFKKEYGDSFGNPKYLDNLEETIWKHVILPSMLTPAVKVMWMNQRVEAENSGLKSYTEHTKQALDEAVTVCKDRQFGQLEDVKAALHGEGRFRLAPDFIKFEIAPQVWHNWPQEKRDAYFQKFLKCLTKQEKVVDDGFVVSQEGLAIKDKKTCAKKPGQRTRPGATRCNSSGRTSGKKQKKRGRSKSEQSTPMKSSFEVSSDDGDAISSKINSSNGNKKVYDAKQSPKSPISKRKKADQKSPLRRSKRTPCKSPLKWSPSFSPKKQAQKSQKLKSILKKTPKKQDDTFEWNDEDNIFPDETKMTFEYGSGKKSPYRRSSLVKVAEEWSPVIKSPKGRKKVSKELFKKKNQDADIFMDFLKDKIRNLKEKKAQASIDETVTFKGEPLRRDLAKDTTLKE